MDNEDKELDAQEGTEAGTQDEATTEGFTLEGAVDEIKSLRKEAAKYRTERNEFQEKLNQANEKVSTLTSKVNDVNEKLGQFGDYEEIKSKLDSVQQENKKLSLSVQLAGKVLDTDKALKLVEEDKHFDDEGNFKVDAFLEENSFLAATKVQNPASNQGNQKGFTNKDLEGKDAEWIAANWDKLRQAS